MKKLATLLEGWLEAPESIQGKLLLDLQRQWSYIAGAELATNSYPKDVFSGVLLIEVLHSSAMQILQLQKQFLLQRLQNDFKQLHVEKIRLKQVPHLTTYLQETNKQKQDFLPLAERVTPKTPKKNNGEKSYQQFLEELLK